MKTFILEWRPSISSYKLDDFENDLQFLEFGEFNWSVWDWKNARSGDNFYMVKCNEGKTGIVMKGFFTSEPYEADDWSGKDRQVHYMDLRPTYMIHPDRCPLLTTGELESLIPNFQWNGGHSGCLLESREAAVLDSAWKKYIEGLDVTVFDQVRADRNIQPESGIDEALAIASEAYYGLTDSNGQPLILRVLEDVSDEDTVEGKVSALLRGVIRMPDFSAGILRERGFSEKIVDRLLQEEC